MVTKCNKDKNNYKNNNIFTFVQLINKFSTHKLNIRDDGFVTCDWTAAFKEAKTAEGLKAVVTVINCKQPLPCAS